jgi:hypothetical protein
VSYSNTLAAGCRVEVRGLAADTQSRGVLIAWAEPSGDGGWLMSHCDGRRVVVGTTVEVLERMIGVACDTSLAERWRRLAGQLPADSPEAATLRQCAEQLAAAAGAAGSGCCRGRVPPAGENDPS